MNKDLFKSGMRAMGSAGNGIAAMGGGSPAYAPPAVPGVPGASPAPEPGFQAIGRGLGGIIKRFKNPELKAPMPIGATDPGSMIQRPRGMPSL